MILIIFIIFLFIILSVFAFPQFSPIPYFPSNKKDINLIIKALGLKNNQTVIDFGAGDGAVIFAASQSSYLKKYNTQFIAVDINPILLLIMQIRKFFNPNKKNIKIVYGNIFNIKMKTLSYNFSNSITFYLYISPWFLKKTVLNIKKQLPKFNIVSYMYKIKSLKKYELHVKGNVHDIFVYKI